MNLPAWKSRAEYDAWCRTNMREFNLLSIKFPHEWERVARVIEVFLAKHRGY